MPKYLDTNIQVKTLSYVFQQIQYRNKRLIIFFFFFAMLHSLQDLSSQTKDCTLAHGEY